MPRRPRRVYSVLADSQGHVPAPTLSIRSRRLRRVAAALVIAAGLGVCAIVLNAALGGGAWEVVALEGQGVPSVDGRPYPHADAFAARVRPGVRLRLPRGMRLILQSRGALAIQVRPATDFTVPRPPGRWWDRRVRCELESGAIRVATAPGFRGATLAVITPAARIELGPGSVAVAAESRGTRVGVRDGVVRAALPGTPAVIVPPGTETFFYSAAIDPTRATLGAADREALEILTAGLAR